MKLYTFRLAPNPRRMHMFLAEKGIEIEDEVEIKIRDNENLEDWFGEINPLRTVPVLELDDGTRISDSLAICRYFEAVQPEPPMFGGTAVEKAMVEYWHRRMEAEGLAAAAESLRNRIPRFADRALTGSRPVAQIKDLVERGSRRTEWYFEDLDARLAESRYVAGDFFSMADITALTTVNFAKVNEQQPGPSLAHIARWKEELAQRPCSSV